MVALGKRNSVEHQDPHLGRTSPVRFSMLTQAHTGQAYSACVHLEVHENTRKAFSNLLAMASNLVRPSCNPEKRQACRGKGIATSNKGITTSSKKLLAFKRPCHSIWSSTLSPLPLLP